MSHRIEQVPLKKLKANYAKLARPDQKIVQLLSIIHITVKLSALVVCLRELKMHDASDMPYSEESLKKLAARLDKLKLVVDQHYTRENKLDLDSRVEFMAARLADEEGNLAMMAKAADILNKHYSETRQGQDALDAKTMLEIIRFRVAIFSNDYATVCQIGCRASRTHELMDGTTNRVLKPLDRDWLRKRHPAIRICLMRDLLERESDYDKMHPEWFELTEEAYSEKGAELCSDYPFTLAEALILRGRIDEAEALIAGAPNPWAGFLQGWIALLRGDLKQSLAYFNPAFTAICKSKGGKKLFMRHVSAPFFLIAQLCTLDSTLMQNVERLCNGIDGSERLESIYCFISNTISAIKDPSRLGDFVTNTVLSAPVMVMEYLKALLYYWVVPESKGYLRHLLRMEKALINVPHRWLLSEVTTLLARLGHESEENLPKSLALQEACRCKPLIELLHLEPPWKRVLDALVQVNREQERSPDAEHTQNGGVRLAWLLNSGNNDCFIKPYKQSRTARGGWNKGSAIPLQTIFENSADLNFLSKQDRTICSHLQAKEGGAYSRRKFSLSFDREAALKSMIGHPHLYRADDYKERIILAEGEPEVRVVLEEGIHKTTFYPNINSHLTYLIIADSPSRLMYYKLGPEHKRIKALLGKGIRVPQASEERLVKTVASLSRSVVVNAELPQLSGELISTPGDPRIHLQLRPQGEGLKLMPAVRPFGEEGPYFSPGEGGQTVFATIKGERRAATRDFEIEQNGLNLLLTGAPSLASGEERSGEWTFAEPEACLILLLELHELGDNILLVWPEGETMQVRSVAAKNLKMGIRSQNEWFQLSGELTIDENEILEMKHLLALTEQNKGRFIPLGDGRYMALTRTFSQRLEELRALAGTDLTRIHSLNGNALEALAEEAGECHFDKEWHEHREKMAAALSIQPKQPNTLQAELRSYQEEGFAWLARLAHWGVGACLADDMGLGKTIQTLTLLLRLAHEGPTLVIAPTSVCANWLVEASRFAPTLKAVRFGQGDRAALMQNAGPYHLIVASYGLLQHETELLSQPQWRAIVLDEAQAIKNPVTRRAQAAFKLKGQFKMVTTGTPIQNNLGDLWSIFHFINPGLLGPTKQFARQFVNPIERYSDIGARNTLKKMVRPFILRRLKNQVLEELPPRTEIVLHVELSQEEQVFYEALRQQAVEKLSSVDKAGSPGHVRILAEIMRLRRACCNPALIDPDTPLAASKLVVFGDVIKELLANQHKALVFSQFVDHLSILRKHLEEQNISYQYLDGSTPAAKRQQRVDAFQKGEGDVFLISLKAGGVGLNLTAADYVLHMDPWWNPAAEDQASDRAHRMGQDRPVTVYRLVTKGTIEEKIVALHTRKRDLARNLLDGTDLTGSMGADELFELIRST